MRDLIEKLMKLSEAPVKPGERKGISFSLKKLDKINRQLSDYKKSLNYMSMATLPPEMQKDLDQLQNKLTGEIKKVQAAYDDSYKKSLSANDRPVKMENLFKALSKNCSQIIKVYKEINRNNFNQNKFLYRGIRSSDDALYGKPYDARKPKDSDGELHELLNNAMDSAGLQAKRDNSTFMTGDRSQASGYGNSLYIMFPVDGFKFTWSKREKDLVLDSSKRKDMMDNNVVTEIIELIQNAKEENPDLPISDPTDLFYFGSSYHSDYRTIENLYKQGLLPDRVGKLLGELINNKSILEYFQFTDQDIFAAINSKKEIYVIGAYYAVNTKHLDELIRFLKEADVDNVELPENFGEPDSTIDDGDIVKVLSGPNKGKLGVVTYTYTDTFEISTQYGEGDFTIDKDQVELYKLPDGSVPTYKEGQKVIVSNPSNELLGTVAKVVKPGGVGRIYIALENSPGTTEIVYTSEISDYSPELEQKLLAMPKPPKFELGQYVRVLDTDNIYYDKIGMISYIYSNGRIEVRFSDGGEVSYAKSNLAPSSEEEYTNANTPAKNNTGYKVGDIVKVIEPESMYVDVIGRIIEVGETAMGSPWIRIEKPDGNNFKTFPNFVEKVSSDSQPNTEDSVNGIKVGDTVQVSNTESGYYGQIGEVIEVNKSATGKDSIKFKNAKYPGGIKTFAGWITKVDDPQQSQQPFKKGDKFKVKQKSYSIDGSIATVIKGPDSDGDYHAVTDDGTTIFTAPFQMEKIKDTPTFNAGDKVKITDNTSGWYGDIGEIKKGPDSDGDYAVIFSKDDNEWSYFQSDAMEKVEQPQAGSKFIFDPTAGSKFTEGDIVKAIGPSAYDNTSYVGHDGTIVSISDDGKFAGVQFDSDNILTYEVSKLSKSETDDIGDLTWEPEPEVTAPAQAATPKFEVNDRVEVTGQYPSLIGKQGTVTWITPTKDFVSVQLDDNNMESSFPITALQKIDKNTTSNQADDFHLGDMVEVSNSNLPSYGTKGKITDMDAAMLVIQGPAGDVFFAKKSSVKKIG